MGFFTKLKESLKKTRENFTKKIDSEFKQEKITEEFYDNLEENLILCDVGVKCSLSIIKDLKKIAKSKKIKFKSDLKEELISLIVDILKDDEMLNISTTPSIILVLGVNGVGKTTTIAKLANYLKKQQKTVLIGAADTFRAAAIDQLLLWANRIDCPVIQHKEGADPAAVVFDTITAAKKRKVDVAICDTAGRLHTKKNLMGELEKIVRITNKEAIDLNKEFLLTIDATTGQNGLNQAEKFKETAKLTGTILTKLDGTAKGGIVIPIKKELSLPIKFIGTGEKLEDLEPFDAKTFCSALFDA